MPAHRLVTGPFASVEPEFLAAVRELKQGDPLRPVEVLVGSNLLAVYLRRRATDETGAVANLRFFTFLDLARELAPADDPRPPLPALGARLLARRALRDTPGAAVFGVLRERDSLVAALLSTADDLREAGFRPEEIPRLLESASGLDDRRRHLRALGAVIAKLETLRRRFRDPTALLEQAAASAVSPSAEPLLVYGLYELGGLRERLLSGIAAARPILAFVPDDGEPDPAGTSSARGPLFEKLLGVAASRRGRAAAARTTARIVVAPSDGAEARETVREILRAGGEGVPLHKIAVLLRNPERQEALLRCELDLRKIPYFRPAGPGFSRSPLGRAARTLVRLAAEDFPRDAFCDLLDLLESLGLLSPLGLEGVSAAAARALLADLGFSAGHEDLVRRMAAARTRLDAPLRAADDPDGRFAGRRSRKRQELARVEEAVRVVARALPETAAAPWADWSSRLRRSFDLLFASADEADRLTPAVEAVAALSGVEPGGKADVGSLHALLPEALDLSPERHGRFERDGVALLSSVSARGLLFDVVLVPGLVEQSFPRPVRPDPLLFDTERQAISRSSGRFLPTRADERPLREERFLFWLARTSARSRLTVLAAAHDVSTDRPRLLSPYLLDLAGGAGREALRARELGEGGPALPPGVRWHPAGRLVLDEPPLDGEDALRRALLRSPALRSGLPPAAAPVSAALARARARQRPFFTEYEGKVEREASGLRLRGRTVSASRLERFAGCPYRAFLERGLRLEPALELDDESPFGLDALAGGNALHAAVRDLTRSLLAGGRDFADLSPSEISGLARDAARLAVQDASAASGAAPPPVLFEIEVAELAKLLTALYAFLRETPREIPAAGAEVRFGPTAADPADRDEDPVLSTGEAVPVPGLPFEVFLAGRIDRLDRSGSRARVIDYKAGKPLPFREENRMKRLIAGGERLQLPVYALAARQLGASEVASEYLFVRVHEGAPKVTATSFDEKMTTDAVARLKEAIVLMDEAVGSGLYLPRTESFRSAEPCRWCDFRDICGPGHERVYERKREGEAASGRPNPLRTLEAIP